MKRFSHWRLPSFVLLACFLTPIARAQFVDEEEVGKFTVGGVLGMVGSNMDDINDNFFVLDEFLVQTGVKKLDNVNTSLLTGLEVRYKFRPYLSLAFTWGALQNRSEMDVERVQARYFSRATTYSLAAYYMLPTAEEWNERLQVYGGVGLMALKSGLVEWRFVDGTTNDWLSGYPPEGLPGDLAEISGVGKATATGSGYHLSLGSSYQLTYRVSAALDVGYRRAKLTDFKYDDADFLGYFEDFSGDVETREPGDWGIYDFFFRDSDAVTPDGRKRKDRHGDSELGKTGCKDCPLFYEGGQIDIDYSGLYAQIAIRFHLF